MRHVTGILTLAVCIALTACGTLSEGQAGKTPGPNPRETLSEVFVQAGAAAWAHKLKFSRVLPDAYIAFDNGGKAVAAGSVQEVKLYQKVTLVMAVRVKDDTYVVEHASVPDIATIKDDAKRKKLEEALAACRGSVVELPADKGEGEADSPGETNPPEEADAVTGATWIEKGVIERLDETRRALAGLLDNPPTDWPRQNLVKSGEAP